MGSPILLLAAVLSALPAPVSTSGLATVSAGRRHGSISWVAETMAATKFELERGLSPLAALGYDKGVPLALAVVPVEDETAGRDGVLAEVRTAQALLDMQRAARRAGLTLRVTSGYRTHEEQAELFALYQRGRGHLASRPGMSNHQSGHALDLDVRSPRVRLWLKRNAGRFGFQRTVPSERWHWEHW